MQGTSFLDLDLDEQEVAGRVYWSLPGDLSQAKKQSNGEIV